MHSCDIPTNTNRATKMRKGYRNEKMLTMLSRRDTRGKVREKGRQITLPGAAAQIGFVQTVHAPFGVYPRPDMTPGQTRCDTRIVCLLFFPLRLLVLFVHATISCRCAFSFYTITLKCMVQITNLYRPM